MKTTLLAAALAMLTLPTFAETTGAPANASQQQNDTVSVHIKGTADKETKMVYVIGYSYGHPKLDSCQVVNGKFNFTSRLRANSRFFLEDDKSERSIRLVSCEPEINADMQTGLVSGSDALLRFSQTQAKIDAINEEVKTLGAPIAADSSLSKEEINKHLATIGRDMRAKASAILDKAVEKDDDAKVYILSYYYYNFFDYAKVNKLLAEGTKARKHPLLADIVNFQLPMFAYCDSLIGLPLPELDDIVDTDGNHLSLSQAIGKGKWTHLDFWSMSCPGCHMYFRHHLPKLIDEFKGKPFQAISVEIYDNEANMKKGQEMYKDGKWKKYWGSHSKEASKQYEQAFSFVGVPFLLVVDPEGIIRFCTFGGSPLIDITLEDNLF